MIILLVAQDFSRFSILVARLRRAQDIDVVPAATGAGGLALSKDKLLDLVIVDEQLDDMSGIAFVKLLVQVNPLVNTAIVSTLSAEDFHEETEGLGVLMQLPPQPKESDAEALFTALAKITGLMEPAARKAGRT